MGGVIAWYEHSFSFLASNEILLLVFYDPSQNDGAEKGKRELQSVKNFNKA